PYVVRPLGTLDPWSLQQKPVRKQVLFHVGVQRMLDRAAAIHYTTSSEQRLAESAVSMKPARGVVIPLGVDEALFTDHGPKSAPPYVLVLGRLHPKKGIETFVEVFLDSAERFPDWTLVIAGDGDADYVTGLKARVASIDPHHRVVFRGWLQGQAKVEALSGAALLALPSR